MYGSTQYSWYTSDSSSYSNIQFDFQSQRVNPTGYMIQYGSWGWKGWTVKGAVTGSDWVVIDSHTNESVMTSGGCCYAFPVPQQSQQFRYIKFEFTQTGSNGKYHLSSYGMEIYGSLIQPT
jgi:hypothetical protein